jgi:hypothetical protein
MELTVVRHDAGGILTTVLQIDHAVIQVLNDIAIAGDCNDAAHGMM